MLQYSLNCNIGAGSNSSLELAGAKSDLAIVPKDMSYAAAIAPAL
jgi:hypothetical protein